MDARIEARLRPGTDYHPLQVIPFLRRWQPSQFRSLVLTAVLCGVIIALIAITITAFGGQLTWTRIQEITVFTLAIGYVSISCTRWSFAQRGASAHGHRCLCIG